MFLHVAGKPSFSFFQHFARRNSCRVNGWPKPKQNRADYRNQNGERQNVKVHRNTLQTWNAGGSECLYQADTEGSEHDPRCTAEKSKQQRFCQKLLEQLVTAGTKC